MLMLPSQGGKLTEDGTRRFQRDITAADSLCIAERASFAIIRARDDD